MLTVHVGWHSQSVALHSYIHCLALLLNWLEYIALSSHCTALRWSTCGTSTSYDTKIILNCITYRYITLYCATLRCSTLRFNTLYIKSRYIALHPITLQKMCCPKAEGRDLKHADFITGVQQASLHEKQEHHHRNYNY